MGKVIKGSPANPERYTVAIPVFVPPPRAYEVPEGDPNGVPDFDSAFALDSALLEPAAPPFDLDAVNAQAQALIDDAARDAQTSVDEATSTARVIVDEANAQAVKISDDARRAGEAAGYAAGVQSAHDEMNDMLDALRDLLEAGAAERHALIDSAEPELVRLAVAIAERVLHQQIALDRGVVVEMAKAAIARIVDREKITVRVNPADVERMREHREQLLALGDVKTMRVIEDQRVDRGGVIIETDAGSIDAKISTQLSEVRKILHIVDDIIVEPAPLPIVDDVMSEARAS